MPNIDWTLALDEAQDWVRNQSYTVTLRQAFYRLVSTQLIPNTESAYKGLSARTAKMRRTGDFPALADGTREIYRLQHWDDVGQFGNDAARSFHLDRTIGQEHVVVIGVEKRGMATAVRQQFEGRGFMIVPAGGYTSATIDIELQERLDNDDRPAVLLYAGDFDATGEDIYRNLLANVNFEHAEKIALSLEQVNQFALPINPGKSTDSRAKAFAEQHGTNMQVEVDALPPDTLANLFEDAVQPYWDQPTFQDIVDEESEIQQQIRDALTAL